MTLAQGPAGNVGQQVLKTSDPRDLAPDHTLERQIALNELLGAELVVLGRRRVLSGSLSEICRGTF